MKSKLILGSLLALSVSVKAQNLFPSPSGRVYVNSNGIITGARNALEIYSANPGDNVGIGGSAPGISLYGGTAVPPGAPGTPFSTPYAKIALATAPGHYLANALPGDFIIQNVGMTPTPIAGNGKSIIFSTRFQGGNGVEHMRINELGNVGIGTSNPGSSSKLHAVGTYVGLRGDGGSEGVAGNGIGSNNTGIVSGIAGRAYDGAYNRGGYFVARDGGTGVASFGVYTEIINPFNLAGGTTYGIFADAGGFQLGGVGPKYAGYFNGDVVTTSASFYPSDQRIKKDITKITNSLDLINKLNPVTYNFDTKSNASIALPSEKQYGFISQEVQKIFPEFTKTIIHPAKLDEEGNELSPKKEILGLNYNGFIALLAKGIQEQQEIIESQQSQINELTEKISNVTGLNTINTVETGFQMSQNEPNPFTHETIVKYTLPQTISNAFMAVYDLTGKQITTFPITEKGASSITITSEKLAAGIYIYSIVADGKVVDSKRMIVAEK